MYIHLLLNLSFNTQPPEGGWQPLRKLALCLLVSTHSRLKAAGWHGFAVRLRSDVSTHSRLKAAGLANVVIFRVKFSFNTQPPEGGWPICWNWRMPHCVSTHSRLKAAGDSFEFSGVFDFGFNTQPPEGGWFCFKLVAKFISGFNTQPPEGGWQTAQPSTRTPFEFQHTAA